MNTIVNGMTDVVDVVDVVDAQDRGFLYGDGLFETICVRKNYVRWFDAHVARLSASAKHFDYPESLLGEALDALNHCRASRDGLWRVTVTRSGQGVVFGGSHGAVRVRHRACGTHAHTAHIGVMKGWYLPDDFLAEHKTTSYLRAVEARRLCTARGFDEALRVSTQGVLGEACAANVFVVYEGTIHTPQVKGLLPGVTRQGVMELCTSRGLDVREGCIQESLWRDADEIFLTSAGLGVWPVSRIEGRDLDVSWSTRIRRWVEEA